MNKNAYIYLLVKTRIKRTEEPSLDARQFGIVFEPENNVILFYNSNIYSTFV